MEAKKLNKTSYLNQESQFKKVLLKNESLGTEPLTHRFLKCGEPNLDQLLQGRLRFGTVSEWGLPPGQGLRPFIIKFLASSCGPAVWIHSSAEKVIYPPAWSAAGAPLDELFFISSVQPVSELKPLFLEGLFSVIVLDGPEKLKRGEMAFLASQAREIKAHIFLLRPFFLSQKSPNPYARVRVNGQKSRTGDCQFQLVRGGVGKVDIPSPYPFF